MTMPGRKYSATGAYRYGFNGKENDKDVSEGIQDYGMRIYDARIAKFLSIDPITSEYPELTPYQFADNNPIQFIDLEGEQKFDPKQTELLKTYLSIERKSIINIKNQISKTTDKKLLKELQNDLTIHKKRYSGLLKLSYMNKMSNLELIVYYYNQFTPAAKEFLDLSPIGDIKVIISGKNFKGEESSRLAAFGWLALDLVGGEFIGVLAKGSRSLKLLKGPGKDALEAIIKKVNNISSALDNKHITAAVNDILGKPVIINGKAYDHLTEVKNALKGIGNQITKLDEIIKSSKYGDDVKEAAGKLRNDLQKQKDNITDILNRAKRKKND